MLINRSLDMYEKVNILGSMAGGDVLSGREHGNSARTPYSSSRRNPIPGVYRAAMPNGKYINLMRVMFTDFCKMDCAFCPNSHWVPRKRYAFKVDELADAFMELQRRHAVAGLFLNSGGSRQRSENHGTDGEGCGHNTQKARLQGIHSPEGDAGDRISVR